MLTGAAGQLGGAMVRELGRGADVAALTRADLDITDLRAVRAAMAAVRPEAVVNCAAYNDVDAAEDDPVAALQVNAFGVGALARAAAERGAVLVHFSTDFVFDGEADRPYTEEDRPNPKSVYAASKLMGEWLARDAPRAYVLRVESLFGGAPGAPSRVRGSVARIARAIEAGEEVPVFVDRTVSPTFVADAVAAVRALLAIRPPAGLYHCVNSGACTWRELAEEAARLLGRPARLRAITLADAKLRAVRPRYCALSNRRLADAGIPMPPWRDALRRALADRLS